MSRITNGQVQARRAAAALLLALLVASSTAGCPASDGATCLQFDLIEGQAQPPSNVTLFFSVSSCSGDPAPGIDAGEFVIREDGAVISAYESQQTILPRSVAFELSSVLLLDMSGSVLESGGLPTLQSAAHEFIDRVSVEHAISIQLFDGREDLTEAVGFTENADALHAAVDALTELEVVDPSTNLNGAVLSGLSLLDSRELAAPESFAGSLVVFTDGTDQAGRVSDEAAAAAAAATHHSTFSIGLGAEIDKPHLSALGQGGAEFASDGTEISEAFNRIADAIEARSQSFYALGYCSPKRAGLHSLSLGVEGAEGELVFDFDAAGFEAGCDATISASGPIELDLLFVVDNSSSGCRLQVELSNGLADLLDGSTGSGITTAVGASSLDWRAAVVTTDMLSEGHIGSFRHHPAVSFPPACGESRAALCDEGPAGDEECAAAFGWEQAVCDIPWGVSSAFPRELCDGSLLTRCTATCSSNADCSSFGPQGCDPDSTCSHKCLPINGECVPRPPTDSCPDSDTLGQLLGAGDWGAHYAIQGEGTLLACAAAVGAEQTKNAGLEQGLGAALAALESAGTHTEQAAGFLRASAHLAIFWITDADDCSLAPGETLAADYYDECPCMASAPEGGPLLSTAEAASRLQALKSDQELVLVGALVGGAASSAAERLAFREAFCNECATYSTGASMAYACEADGLRPQVGARYLEVVELFGEHGFAADLCTQDVSTAATAALEHMVGQIAGQSQ